MSRGSELGRVRDPLLPVNRLIDSMSRHPAGSRREREMRKVLLLLLLLPVLPAHAGNPPLHPVGDSVGGVAIGNTTDCTSSIDVKLFAHYIDTNGNEANEIITTAMSTCQGTVAPWQSTFVHLFDQHGHEIGRALNCWGALTCQRSDWISGKPGDTFTVEGSALWGLPNGIAAWFQCQDTNAAGMLVTGRCNYGNDKWASIDSYADWLLV